MCPGYAGENFTQPWMKRVTIDLSFFFLLLSGRVSTSAINNLRECNNCEHVYDVYLLSTNWPRVLVSFEIQTSSPSCLSRFQLCTKTLPFPFPFQHALFGQRTRRRSTNREQRPRAQARSKLNAKLKTHVLGVNHAGVVLSVRFMASSLSLNFLLKILFNLLSDDHTHT